MSDERKASRSGQPSELWKMPDEPSGNTIFLQLSGSLDRPGRQPRKVQPYDSRFHVIDRLEDTSYTGERHTLALLEDTPVLSAGPMST